MKNVTYNMRLSLLFVAGGGLVACAPLFGEGPSRPAMPAARTVQTDLGSAISYYDKAVTAINLRRYALALDYLQAARAQKPADVRVLTAFGVVYDKLGRFDLSARYYGQAAAVEPQSKIIAADMDYSRRLQGFAAADAPPASLVAANPIEGTWHLTIGGAPQLPVEKAPAVPAGAVNTNLSPLKIAALAEAKVLRKGEAEKPAPTKAVFLTGHPLTISDASGRGDAGQSVRSYLSGLRWTLAKGEVPKLPAQTQTVILYKESLATVAKALARTLTLPVRLMVNQKAEGLQLVLGSDLSGARLHAMAPPPRRLALAVNTGKRE